MEVPTRDVGDRGVGTDKGTGRDDTGGKVLSPAREVGDVEEARGDRKTTEVGTAAGETRDTRMDWRGIELRDGGAVSQDACEPVSETSS